MEKTRKSFRGMGTAIITPFKENGEVDFVALGFLVEMQVRCGANFIVPCGTTGESPTLEFDEHVAVIKNVVEVVGGRIPVLAGTGSNSTAEAVALTLGAKKVGADGALVVSPYYNKPTPAGMLDYYRQVAAVGLPVVLYDVPFRTACRVPTDVIITLAKEESIVGLKWASGDLKQLSEVIDVVPDDFDILSGDDQLTYQLMALGGHGVISVLGNLLPSNVAELVRLFSQGKVEDAKKLHDHLLPLMTAMFIETNPIPIKTAMAHAYPEIISEVFRSPMCAMEPANKAKLFQVMESVK